MLRDYNLVLAQEKPHERKEKVKDRFLGLLPTLQSKGNNLASSGTQAGTGIQLNAAQ